MDYLTTAQKAQIDQAMFDAMDTLHRSIIKLYVKSQSLDIRQTNATATYVEYELKTIIKEVNKDNEEGVEGSRDVNRFETKFHIQHLIDAGLADTNRKLLFNSSECILEYQGKQHRLVAVTQEDIAVRIECEASPVDIVFEAVNLCPTIPEPQRYSMEFNGLNQYGQVSQTASSLFDLDWQQPFTFETWYYHTLGQTMYFLSKINTAAGYFFSAGGSSNVIRLQIRTTASSNNILDVLSTSTLSAGWNHIVIRSDGSGDAEQGITFDINSVQGTKPNNSLQSPQLIGGSSTNNQLLEVSRISAFGVWGKGIISHIRLWNNVELTDSEVTSLYNGGQVLYDNIPQDSSLLFETGFMDENHGWFGVGWLMEELTGRSNFIYGSASTFSDRINDIPQ